MKLNIDILIDSLSELFPVRHYGYHSEKMSLSLREYYDGTDKFLADHIYIISPDLLPEYPSFEEGAVIICNSGKPSPKYFSPEVTLLVLETDKSIPSIFNIVNRIFERYEKWDLDLQNISAAAEKNTLDDLLKSSLPIFQNTIFIIDNQLKVLSIASPPNSGNQVVKYKNIDHSTPSVEFEHYSNYYKKLIGTDWKKRDVYLSDEFTPTLCISLYDHDNYLATCNVQVAKNSFEANKQNPFKASDKALLKHLSYYIIRIYKQYHNIKDTDNWQKEFFIKAITGETYENSQFTEKKITHCEPEKYICIVCKSDDDIRFLPTKYLCKKIEQHLLGTFAIENENMIVILADLNMPKQDEKLIVPRIIAFLDDLGFKCGISDEFYSIKNSNSHFIQAQEALDIGARFNPETRVYYFQDYSLHHMIKMITSKLPVSMLCSSGIIRLLKYDELNNTNFFEELRIYLKNNSNAALTAKECFVHRHTFYNHLKQIVDILQLDLENYNDLLYLQISYKLFEFEDEIDC